DPSKRLYGLEYIPCPVTRAWSDGKLIGYDTNLEPKNTARWIMELGSKPGNRLRKGMYTIETRIGADLTLGSAGNKPMNLSRTYVWVGINPPVTEEYQFLGDPRHMPYEDLKNPHTDDMAAPFYEATDCFNGRYNRYFTTLNLNLGGPNFQC